MVLCGSEFRVSSLREALRKEKSYFFGELFRIIDFYEGNEYIFIGQRFSDQ
jgi:hypothetical protein